MSVQAQLQLRLAQLQLRYPALAPLKSDYVPEAATLNTQQLKLVEHKS